MIIKEVRKEKKLFVILILSLLLINFLSPTLIKAQETPNPPISEEEAERIREQAETKWDYLSRHWKIMLLSNPVVKAIDTAFKKLDSIGFFVVLFAVHWQLSFVVIFSIIMWIFSLFYIKRQLRKLTSLKKEYCYLIALGAVLFLAWAKVFLLLAQGTYKLFTTTTGKIMLIIIFLLVLWGLFFLDKLGDKAKKARQAGKVSETEEKMKRIKKFQEGFEKGAGI